MRKDRYKSLIAGLLAVAVIAAPSCNSVKGVTQSETGSLSEISRVFPYIAGGILGTIGGVAAIKSLFGNKNIQPLSFESQTGTGSQFELKHNTPSTYLSSQPWHDNSPVRTGVTFPSGSSASDRNSAPLLVPFTPEEICDGPAVNLYNARSACYMNAPLQVLRKCRYFIRSLFDETQVGTSPTAAMDKTAIQQFYIDYHIHQPGDKKFDAYDYCRALGHEDKSGFALDFVNKVTNALYPKPEVFSPSHVINAYPPCNGEQWFTKNPKSYYIKTWQNYVNVEKSLNLDLVIVIEQFPSGTYDELAPRELTYEYTGLPLGDKRKALRGVVVRSGYHFVAFITEGDEWRLLDCTSGEAHGKIIKDHDLKAYINSIEAFGGDSPRERIYFYENESL
ncbi:MAG: hypothetical protein LBP36_03105 [Oscillospiraceae bacterium]|jgi:hypothetical protein|nr:hypothetical protein [Oscillospiraceae bacterium]